jgi:hypothetical protein
MAQTMWRVLVVRYAMRAREFSDAVALLEQASLPPVECSDLLKAITVRHESCMVAARDVERYVRQTAAD